MTAEVTEDESKQAPSQPAPQQVFDTGSANWWDGGEKVKIGQAFTPRKIENPLDKMTRRQGGRRSRTHTDRKRGRYIQARPSPGKVDDLAFDATLRAAADAGDAIAVLEQLERGALHVEGDALVDAVILQRPDQFQARAVADVREPRIAVAAEVALADEAVLGAVEHRAPLLELAHAIRRLLGVELGHAPVVDVLAAAHRVREVDLPVVAIVHVAHGRGDPAFGHHRVRLAEQ